VNAAAKGQPVIDVRDGFTIANLNNSYDRVAADVAQISWLTHHFFSGKFERSQVGSLPFMVDGSEAASVAMWRIYAAGHFGPEYDQVKPIALAVLSQAGIHLPKPPASLDILEGLKVITPSKVTGDVMARLGMTPLSMPVTQTYEAIQRGAVNGVVLGWTAVQSFKLEELTYYHADASLGSSTGMMYISRKRYDALPAALRKIIDDHSGEQESRNLGAFWDRLQDLGKSRVKAMEKHTVLDVPAAQVAKWKEKAAPVVAEWAKTTPDGEKVLAAFRAEYDNVKAGR
jgi:TRAP-type C4-dicarboxylate transport system substrate-binding protein